jgi:hypothetical protein
VAKNTALVSNISAPFISSSGKTMVHARRALGSAAGLVSLVLASSHAMAQNTLGSRASIISQDLTTGGGTLLTLFGFILGGFALLGGGWAIYQHTKNPNGQGKMGYGIAGVLAGGFFLTISSIATFSGQTISGAAASSDGTSKQMMFNQ